MAKTDNIKDFCKDIADAIREKKGTSDLINPQDFSAEIKSISGGGGSEGGASESSIEYLDVRGSDELFGFVLCSAFVKVVEKNTKLIVPSAFVLTEGALDKAEAVMVIPDAKFFYETEYVSLRSLFGEYLDSIPRLTKEQFYSLE